MLKALWWAAISKVGSHGARGLSQCICVPRSHASLHSHSQSASGNLLAQCSYGVEVTFQQTRERESDSSSAEKVNTTARCCSVCKEHGCAIGVGAVNDSVCACSARSIECYRSPNWRRQSLLQRSSILRQLSFPRASSFWLPSTIYHIIRDHLLL